MWSLIAFIGLITILVGVVGIIRPMAALYLPTRSRAALAMFVGLFLLSIGAVQDQNADLSDEASTEDTPAVAASADDSSPASSAPPAAPTPFREIEGRGDDVIDVPSLRNGLLMVGAAHKGDRNFALQLRDERGGLKELIVNTIGNYTGTRIFPVAAGTHTLQVNASGPWFVTYNQPSPDAATTPPPIERTATGDYVVGPIQLPAGLLRVSFTHKGDSNFAVMLYSARGQRVGVLVNEIGDYSGTVAEQVRTAGPHYFDIRADGESSIKIP